MTCNMTSDKLSKKIRRVAKELDDAVEKHNIESILACFLDDCEVEISGITLHGKDHLKKAIDWLYDMVGEIKFQPLVILTDGDVFFEEFVLRGNKQGKKFAINVAEVLIYKDYKVKTLRLYLDRLQVADNLVKRFFDKLIVNLINKKMLKALI